MSFKDFFDFLDCCHFFQWSETVSVKGLMKNICVNHFEFGQAIEVEALFKELFFFLYNVCQKVSAPEQSHLHPSRHFDTIYIHYNKYYY